MTPRENLRLLLDGEPPSWVPFTLDVGSIPGFTRPVQERFERETGARDPAEHFDYDFRLASVAARSTLADPRACYRERVPEGATFDEWGIGHWAGGAAGTYEQMFHPLAAAGSVAQVEALPCPRLDAAGVAERVRRFHDRGYPVMAYAGSVYEWSWWLRGMEDFMADLLTQPELARAIVAKVAAHTTALALETAAQGVDVLAFYDDAGMQSGMQISPELWRTFIKPAWREVLGTVRGRHPEVATFLHSCGNITAIVPDIVELGFDFLHPVQPECMDAAALRSEFGQRIVLCATLGAQGCFAFGTPAQVREETRRLIASLGPQRRGLLCPSNIVQPETPWENIVAFAETARAAGERRLRPEERRPAHDI